jgi:hypothetical protein
MALSRGERQILGLLDEDLAVRAVPGRDLVAPPQLARDAPRLDVAHPLEIGLFPVFRHEDGAALLDGLDGGLGQRRGVHIPLLGEPRLDRHAAAVAMGHGVGVGLDALDEVGGLEPFHDQPARLEAVDFVELERLLQVAAGLHAGEELVIAGEHQPAMGIEHVDHRQIVAAADLEVVEVVGRRHLHRAPEPVSGSA